MSILELDQKSLFYTVFIEILVYWALWGFHRLVYEYDHKNIFDTEKTQWLPHRLVWEPLNTLGFILLCAYHYTVDKMQALHHMVGLCKWIGITLLYKTSAPFVEYIIPW